MNKIIETIHWQGAFDTDFTSYQEIKDIPIQINRVIRVNNKWVVEITNLLTGKDYILHQFKKPDPIVWYGAYNFCVFPSEKGQNMVLAFAKGQVEQFQKRLLENEIDAYMGI